MLYLFRPRHSRTSGGRGGAPARRSAWSGQWTIGKRDRVLMPGDALWAGLSGTGRGPRSLPVGERA